MLPPGYFNVVVLGFTNAMAFAVTPMMMLVGSLLGVELAPSAQWATLPIAMMVVGTALGVVPATQLMQRIGRKYALWLFMLLSLLACLLASHSLLLKSFGLFCLSASILGFSNATFQQIRFAAMECVPLEQGATAASLVLLGGVLAAIVGPELAVMGRELTTVDYQGSFWLVAGTTVIAALLLSLYTPAPQLSVAKITASRPTMELVKTPAFILAVTSGALAFAVMTFVMTCTPISMHNHHGHSLLDTKWVIQWHIAAMFLPSLVSPLLFRLLGAKGMMLTGLACYGCTIIIGLMNITVIGFWMQLVVLGIGWNFLFVAGTALLPSSYKQGEQFKAQAINDSTVFSIQALASLSAGWAIGLTSWQGILLLSLLPMVLMLLLIGWYSRDRSNLNVA